MHVNPLFIVVFLLLAPRLFGAPVYDASRRALIRTVAPPQLGLPHVGHSNRVTLQAPARNKVTYRRVVFTRKIVSRFNKLTLKSSTQSSATARGALCPKNKRDSTLCRLSSISSPTGYSDGTELQLHPDGKNGPDTEIKKTATVGKHLGSGSFGAVYDIASHDLGAHHGDLVAKKYFAPNSLNQKEINNLRKVDLIRASGMHGGRDWVVMDKVKGQLLQDTEAFRNADALGPMEVNDVLKQAHTLTGDALVDHAERHGLIHTDVHHDNVRYEEHNGQLIKAHLLDWGLATEAPGKGPDEKFTQEEEHAIRFSYPASYLEPKEYAERHHYRRHA